MATYRVALSAIQQLLSALGSGRASGDLAELLENLQKVPAEKVPPRGVV